MAGLGYFKRKDMIENESVQKIKSELQRGINLAKCRKCGCMQEVLKTLHNFFSKSTAESSTFVGSIKSWLTKIQPLEYSCLGCRHCYPAIAMNIFNQAFPKALKAHLPTCDSEVRAEQWPPVPGEYFAFGEGVGCPVAVSTLASVRLAEDLAKIKSKGLCIVGKTETENIGIDKIIKNTITNPTIRFLIITGKDPVGHQSGKTLFALYRNGVDKNMKVIGTPASCPVLRNVRRGEIEAFRKQVQLIDMIGCEDVRMITEKIDELSKKAISTCEPRPGLQERGESKERPQKVSTIQISSIPKIVAASLKKVKMDKAGYFVIIPLIKNKTIIVEHYAYANKLLRTIEGRDAVTIYSTIIGNGWLTELSHAAYLGRELTKAELSLKYGFKYVQDKAAGM